MMNRWLLIVVIFCGFPETTIGQYAKCPKIPESYSWSTAEDYKKDLDLVKKTIKWLCITPFGIEVQQRSIANAFVMEWLAGSPQIRIEIETENLTFYEKFPDLMFSFIHGVAWMMLEKPTALEELIIYGAGYETVASLVSQSEELSKKGELRPLLRAFKKNHIREYTKEALRQKDTK
jgi:hypothetical protein